MNRYKYLILLVILLILTGCASALSLYTLPMSSYQAVKGVKVGTPALPYYAYSRTTLEVINEDFKNANAKVTLADTYNYGYGKSFENLPPDGDTGQTFDDMATATKYFQKILKAKKVPNADRYFLTSIDSAKNFGFALIATVYRNDNNIVVYNKFGASDKKSLNCDDPPYYRPYKYDCNGKPLDMVYEWAAVPNDCFEKQGHQAILLTLAANKVLEKQHRADYWAAERKWIAGDYKSVVINQDNMVCQQLGIESGYVDKKNNRRFFQ